MKRSALLPEIPIDETLQSTELETFQNKVLRPILKFQNDYILQSVFHVCTSMAADFKTKSLVQRKRFVNDVMRSNAALKHQLIGLVVAWMEIDQLAFYLAHQSDVNKRISQMAVERVVSQL
jgi:stress-induced morphogen